MKLRLLVTKKCERNCLGCCNRDWDLEKLPLLDPQELQNYDEILITGGEPTLELGKLARFLKLVRELSPNTKIYVYTAESSKIRVLLDYCVCDGVTLTLHEKQDIANFCMNRHFTATYEKKSMRLNVFGDFTHFKPYYEKNWIIKDNIEWIKNCPLSKDEIFKQFILF